MNVKCKGLPKFGEQNWIMSNIHVRCDSFCVMKSSSHLTFRSVAILLLVYLFYSTVSIATKFTSMQEMLSLRYFMGLAIVVTMLGVYAVIWQQVLKRIELTTAYMFKGTSLIFVLMFSALIFNETITVWNVVGAGLIIGGIVWFAKS